MNPILCAQFNLPCGVTDRYVRLESGQWIGASGEPVTLTISSARLATDDEAACYEACRLTVRLTALVEERGAPALAALLDTLGADRDEQLCFVVDELRRRGKDGLASQCAAFRFQVAS